MHNKSIFFVAALIANSMISGSSASPFCALFKGRSKTITFEPSEERGGYGRSRSCKFELVEAGKPAAHASLELIENELLINRRSVLSPISLYVAGGMSKEISADGVSDECYKPIRFFTMTHNVASNVVKGHHSERGMMARLHTGQLQKQVSLTAAVAYLKRVNQGRPALVIDLQAWLEDYRGAGWQRTLPILRLSCTPAPFPVNLIKGSCPFVDLTAEEVSGDRLAKGCEIQ